VEVLHAEEENTIESVAGEEDGRRALEGNAEMIGRTIWKVCDTASFEA